MVAVATSRAVVGGQDFFRINQDISPFSGLLFSIDQSVAAICIGPNSDIDVCTIAYPDAQGNLLGATYAPIQLSQKRPWFGNLDAKAWPEVNGVRTGVIYTSIGSPLPAPTPFTSPLDEPRLVPFGYFSNFNIDIVFYFTAPQQILNTRAPRVFVGNSIFVPVGITSILSRVPFYGRRQFTFSAKWTSNLIGFPGGPLTVKLVGTKFALDETGNIVPVDIVIATVNLSLGDTCNFSQGDFGPGETDYDALTVYGDIPGDPISGDLIVAISTMEARD